MRVCQGINQHLHKSRWHLVHTISHDQGMHLSKLFDGSTVQTECYEINQPAMLYRIKVNINSRPKYLKIHRTLPLANEATGLLSQATLVVLLFERARSGALLVVLPVVQLFQSCVDALQNGLVLPVSCNTDCRFRYMH